MYAFQHVILKTDYEILCCGTVCTTSCTLVA
ncbi:MAG: hypothetical protein ACI8RD_009818 [Bacillariaceae sp.]|jgi:hypothetical protein